MDLAIQLASNCKKLGGETIQESEDYKSQPLQAQVIRGEELVALLPAIRKRYNSLEDEIMELTIGNIIMENRISEISEKRLEKSKEK